MENLVGQKLNQRYEIISLLGEGGMGAVLKGFDPVLEREIAVKVMHPHFSKQPNMRERFLQEARTAGKLNHSSIVKVYDFGQQGSLLYIIMEFIAGDNLRVILDHFNDKHQWLSLQESTLVTAQLASALHYAHSRGVLHRDIKPANIMIVPEPIRRLAFRPVLTDLGLAKLLEGQPITQEGVSMGTPAYMSPEQALGQTIDARSDVYSLGILLYELCVRRPPFPAKTISEAIRYHTQEPPEPPGRIRADIPTSVENVILKAIAKKPEDRYANAETLAQALLELEVASTRISTGGAPSLMTEYQQSLVERGKSVLREFVAVSSSRQDVLQVIDPDQKGSSHPLSGTTITIGRGKDNDIVIEDNKLSRQHARLENNGKDYFITDLESTNGTFLANTRLLPGVPELWPADKALRMGNSWLNLKRAAQVDPEQATDRYTRAIEPGQDKPLSQDLPGKRVTVKLDSDHLQVNPGESIQIPVQLLNHGQLVDHYRLNIKGIPAEWVTVSQTGVQLMPGERGELRFSIHPPRQPESKAGNYPLTIKILSQVAASETSEISATLTIHPYYQFDFVIRPQRQRGTTEARFSTIFRNLCNTELSFDLEGEDLEGLCLFTFEPENILSQPGHETSGKMIVHSRQVLQSEINRSYSLTITARAQQKPELVKKSFGEWERTPLLLDVKIHPSMMRSINKGKFKVTLQNKGDQDIPVQLEGVDEEAQCEFQFDPKSVVVLSGKESQVDLAITTAQPLRLTQEKTIRFTVNASFVKAPELKRYAEGKWVRIAPDFEGQLSTVQGQGGETGKYNVVLKNLTEDEISLALSAVDQKQKCTFEFGTSTIHLPAGGEQSVSLTVKPLDRLHGEDRLKHSFQVVIQPDGFPENEKRLDAVWEQLATVRNGSLFLCWLFICIGWAIGIGFSALVVNEFLMYGSSIEGLISGLIGGAISGGIGGLLTGIGIKIAQPDFKFSHIIGTTIAWAAVWAFYLGPMVLLFN